MTESVDDPQVEQQEQEQPAQSEDESRAAELASLNAGYNRTPGQAPALTDEAPAEEAMPQLQEPPQELVETRKKVDELESMVNGRLQKVFNQLGNLSQKLETIGSSSKEVTHAEAKVITSDSLKKLKELGYDEIAEALAEDLSSAITGGADAQTVAQITSDALKKAREEDAQNTWQKAVEALDEAHPDRHEVIKTPEFAKWESTLPASKRHRLHSSNNPDYVIDRLDEFKEWRVMQAETAGSNHLNRTQTNESRLANAVTPTTGRSAGSPTRLPDEAGLWAGYNKGHKPFKR